MIVAAAYKIDNSHIKKVKYTDEKYEGNKAICNRSFISDDGEKAIAFNNIETENFNPSKACKRCLQIIGMDTINYESKVKDQSTTQQWNKEKLLFAMDVYQKRLIRHLWISIGLQAKSEMSIIVIIVIISMKKGW